ncbi:efflux RND transporter periplasmic adaptor subunit [Parvularcula oceani]|uniref:efflux RND transporter periplasmic adaptor subunit n=1 Tax=Parvularcula oceani TaxID=1247963 RepID=UPI00055C1C7B|nr:efflux RND transporter periplasmic adaptor subunit [Parvularcula oceani]
MKRKILVIAVSLAVPVGFFVLISVLGSMRPERERQEAETQAPAVFVEDAEFEPVALKVYTQGEVEPRREIQLTSQISGVITEVSDSFADGGVFEAGEVLVRLEDADYELAKTRAEAQVAQASQALAIEQAEAALARQDYEELAGGEGTPSGLTLREPQLARAEAEFESAKANLRDAELALERTTIEAPFAGRVRSIGADVGQFVSPGTQLGQVFSTAAVEIRLPLTDADLARLDLPLAFTGEGPRVNLSTSVAGALREWEGRIVRVDAAVDPTTRLISAIARVDDPYGANADDGFPLAVGLFVDAVIEGPALDRALVLPRLAVQDDGTVYVVDEENRLRRREVTVAARTPEGVIVTAGVEPDERVVVSRLPTAVGNVVRPLSADEAAASEPAEDEAEAGGLQADRRRANSGRAANAGAN